MREKIPLKVARDMAPETSEHNCGVKGELKCGQTFAEAERRFFDFIYYCANCGKYFYDNRKSL